MGVQMMLGDRELVVSISGWEVAAILENYFLSYHDAKKVVILSLKGVSFDKVVLESEDPEQLANDIRSRCTSH
ncbi:hypothetical protein RE628_18185 [Paenibacillus sp. D2_2]|uniref:hypothetical protein n=1 Tax=Paenibacillus sp. D2_2 TaxID=3073092 RepID=UPI0028166596|nr:hypothetical protein [Paenibacillus sp. D2_2]WMT39369.1 hypothetical protein RE628_18185 [Paenibacillus sp. D2_2]